MARIAFTDPGTTCCTLPPFSQVTNRQYFFRINTFEIELPSTFPPSFRDVKNAREPLNIARLGVPLADLFPDLLPDFPPQFAVIGRSKTPIRNDRGVFLPAATLNKTFSDARIVAAATGDLSRKSIRVDGKRIALDPQAIRNLQAGRAATVIEGRMLVRVTPPAAPVPKSQKSAASNNSIGRLATATLDDETFEELCDALFEGRYSATFSDTLAKARYGTRALLRLACKRDPRFAAYDRLRHGKNWPALPRYEIGYLTEFEQTWDLAGYSRGSLVSSITLAPAEELTIEVFTFDRQKLEDEQNRSTETERSVESSSLARISSQLGRELSETTDKNASLGLGAALPIEAVKVDVDGQVGVTQSIATGAQSTVEAIDETTRRAAERFKTTTQVKVVQTRETGSETRVTRKIQNPNRGRTLTMHCFEVLEHYQVTTRLLRADHFVMLVEMPRPAAFDVAYVLAHEEKLQRALLGPGYLPGFEAARKLLAQDFFDGRSGIKAEIEAAQAKARGDKAAPGAAPEQPIVALAKQLHDKLGTLVNLDLVGEVKTLAESYLPFSDPVSAKEKSQAHAALGMANFWIKFKLVTPGVETRATDFLTATGGTLTPDKAYAALSALTTGLDDEWLTTAKMIAANVVSLQLGFTLLIPFPWLLPVMLEFAMIEDNLGIPPLLEKAKQAVRAFEVTMNIPPPGTPPAAGAEAAAVIPPPQLYPITELALADADFRKLQLHLEANAVYYHNSLFGQLDANVRFEMLRALGIHASVENRLLGFVGSRAVFPLKLESLEDVSRRFLLDKVKQGLPAAIAALPAPRPQEVVVPTSGLHMEPVLGQCEALEKYLVDRRDLDLRQRAASVLWHEGAAEQMKAEARRLNDRLDQDPPLLEASMLPASLTPVTTADDEPVI